MYNFRGIYYQMTSDGLICLLDGILFLLLSKCWNPQKRDLKKMIGGIVCMIFFIVSLAYYSNIVKNPVILTHEGYFSREYRRNVGLFRMSYYFTNGDGVKPGFFLDVFSKKEIYPEDFNSEQKYRIYYEDETNIIVCVEKIE